MIQIVHIIILCTVRTLCLFIFLAEFFYLLRLFAKRMFKDIGLYLAKINPVEQQEKTVRDAVDRGQLKDMRTFLRDADVGAVKEILAEIDRYEYNDADIEFLNALKMTVDAMDYEGASEIIDQYLNSK